METEKANQNYFTLFLLHMMGFFSTLSLLFILLYLVASILKGDLSIWNDFMIAHPGIQPFLIFITPVLLISSPAWLFYLVKKKH